MSNQHLIKYTGVCVIIFRFVLNLLMHYLYYSYIIWFSQCSNVSCPHLVVNKPKGVVFNLACRGLPGLTQDSSGEVAKNPRSIGWFKNQGANEEISRFKSSIQHSPLACSHIPNVQILNPQSPGPINFEHVSHFHIASI